MFKHAGLVVQETRIIGRKLVQKTRFDGKDWQLSWKNSSNYWKKTIILGESNTFTLTKILGKKRSKRQKCLKKYISQMQKQLVVGTPKGGGSYWKFGKFDLPIFDSENRESLLMKAENYFTFYRLNDEEKVEATVVSMEGEALVWYKLQNGRTPIAR